jgi:Co/Zn/Cd efflux system component
MVPYYWLDLAVAIIISTIIAASAGRLLRDVVSALRHGESNTISGS